jgi:hypothetical protein
MRPNDSTAGPARAANARSLPRFLKFDQRLGSALARMSQLVIVAVRDAAFVLELGRDVCHRFLLGHVGGDGLKT